MEVSKQTPNTESLFSISSRSMGETEQDVEDIATSDPEDNEVDEENSESENDILKDTKPLIINIPKYEEDKIIIEGPEPITIPLSPAPIYTTRSEHVQKESVDKRIQDLSNNQSKSNPNNHVNDLIQELLNMFGKNDKETMMSIKFNLERIKSQVHDQTQNQLIQLQLLRGQLERRSQLLTAQRSDYLKELTLLREELFRKRADANYKPTDFTLHTWYAQNVPENYKRDRKNKNKSYQYAHLEMKKLGERSLKERQMYIGLKKQTEQVAETIKKLKELEAKRKKEISQLRKKQKETDALYQSLIMDREKYRLYLQREEDDKRRRMEEEEKKRILKRLEEKNQSMNTLNNNIKTISKEISGTIMERKDNPESKEPLDIDISQKSQTYSSPRTTITSVGDTVTSNTTDVRLQVNENIKDADFTSRSQGSRKSTPNRENIEIGEDEEGEEKLTTLENEITLFQDKFNDLFSEMALIKHRLKVYESEKTPINKDDPPGPEGFITLIFTDVQDSTRLWELNANIMAEGIKIHNNVMRMLLKDLEGFEVKTEGDAFMCAFSSVHKAVEFAIQAQIGLVNAPWPESLLKLEPARIEIDDNNEMVFRGLRVRMGIHSGTPIVEKDPVTGRADYFGPVVNRAARVEGQAQGGQIVISSSVWDQIKDNIAKNEFSTKIWTKFIGSVKLKGMDEPETIRLMLPDKFKFRKFAENTSSKESESSVKLLKEKLSKLQSEHRKLDVERSIIQEKIQFKLKIQTLEDSMKEKDNIINFLKTKVDELKQSCKDIVSDVTSSAESKKEQIAQNRRLQNDIDVVMDRYEEMKEQYQEMRGNYDNVVKIFNKKLKNELEGFRDEISQMNDKLEEKDREKYLEKREWEAEKRELRLKLEYKDKVMEQKDYKIKQLKKELILSKLNINRNAPHMQNNSPRSPKNPRSPHSNANLINMPNTSARSMSSSLPSTPARITMDEVSAMLKNIIKEAIGMYKKYADFDWRKFLHEERTKRLNRPSKSVSQKKTLKIFDKSTGKNIQVAENELRAWGISQFMAMDAFSNIPSPPPTSFNNAKESTSFVDNGTQNQSYSRMLEQLQNRRKSSVMSHETSSRNDQEVIPHSLHTKPKKKELKKHQLLEQFIRDAIYVPQSSRTAGLLPDIKSNNIVNQHPRIKKWISLVVTSNGPLANRYKELDSHPEFKYLSKEQKQEELLKTLYLEKNSEQYQGIELASTDYQANTPEIDSEYDMFKNDAFAVFGIRRSDSNSLFDQSAHIRKLIGLKKDKQHLRSNSSFETRRLINEKLFCSCTPAKRSASSMSHPMTKLKEKKINLPKKPESQDLNRWERSTTPFSVLALTDSDVEMVTSDESSRGGHYFISPSKKIEGNTKFKSRKVEEPKDVPKLKRIPSIHIPTAI